MVEEFVWKMVHVSDNEFEYPESTKEEKIRCTKLKTIKLHYEDAVRYRAMSGKRVIRSKWEDLRLLFT